MSTNYVAMMDDPWADSLRTSAVPILTKKIDDLCAEIERMGLGDRVEAINAAKLALHRISPMADEPVDCVLWVPAADVTGNDYNPNSVAPPEMELLKVSILADGYTQPIVVFGGDEDRLEVVDGFHRSRVGKECPEVATRVHGYLPVVTINDGRADRGDRIAATIRHNRARGKHRVDAMSDIVVELKRRNWSDDKIARELGMDPDEILRLTQVTGLAELFANQDFSMSWEIGTETVGEIILEDDEGQPSAEGRIYHTFDQWECYPAGFYNNQPRERMEDPEGAYAEFLRDDDAFRVALGRVISEWPNSCAHYLTNANMNRIAWLGQAAACIARGIPAAFRAGFHRLAKDEQLRADATALEYLNLWRAGRGEPALSAEDAAPRTKADLY